MFSTIKLILMLLWVPFSWVYAGFRQVCIKTGLWIVFVVFAGAMAVAEIGNFITLAMGGSIRTNTVGPVPTLPLFAIVVFWILCAFCGLFIVATSARSIIRKKRHDDTLSFKQAFSCQHKAEGARQSEAVVEGPAPTNPTATRAARLGVSEDYFRAWAKRHNMPLEPLDGSGAEERWK